MIDWREVRQPTDIINQGRPKPTEDSWNIVLKILESKCLMATCSEKLYGYRETDRFCCVTDIPLHHLDKHKLYYGDVAIGFNSTKIYESFNPVLYVKRSGIINKAIEIEEGHEERSVDFPRKMGIDSDTAKRSGFVQDEQGNYRTSK